MHWIKNRNFLCILYLFCPEPIFEPIVVFLWCLYKISLKIRHTKRDNIHLPLCIYIFIYMECWKKHSGQIFVLCQIFFKCDHMTNMFSHISVRCYLMKQEWENKCVQCVSYFGQIRENTIMANFWHMYVTVSLPLLLSYFLNRNVIFERWNTKSDSQSLN